jgi:endonuclease/exonuclease/phosphatase family metal-dependent hydrolase
VTPKLQLSILTWNIKCGADSGVLKNGWPTRKRALKEVLAAERFDVLCIQEGLSNQLRFMDECLPDYQRFGVGRTDGVSAGEHCSIFVARKRFEQVDDGTFWLSDTPGKPSRSYDLPPLPPRVCSWTLLREKDSGRRFRVFNTHFPLMIGARKKSATVLVAEFAKVHPKSPALLTGDFNCRPGTAPRKIFEQHGLRDAEVACTGKNATKTWHLRGRPVICLDGIYATREWKVLEFQVACKSPGKVHASDHFGLRAKLELS